ncbi:MAG: YibE/F family protein [Patescibacteria group bacterium]
MIKKIIPALLLLISLFSFAHPLHAQEQALAGTEETLRAKVITVIIDETKIHPVSPDASASARVQTLEAEILEGAHKDKKIIFENNNLPLAKGDHFLLYHLVDESGGDYYNVQDPERRGILLVLILLFIATVILFGRLQGVRSLLALAGSGFIIAFFLFPQLLAGRPPLLISAVVSIFILTLAILITHGWNRTSLVALAGTSITIAFTILFAQWAVGAAHLTGLIDDTSIYLNTETGGTLNFQGLLLSAIIIGILGILDDVAITQTVAVQEIATAGPALSKKEVYRKAMRVGREHVGALVNTLALAYAGASLPLLLLFSKSGTPPLAVNMEIFAAEIVRTIVGSMAIILTVPITTALAVWFGKNPGKGYNTA